MFACCTSKKVLETTVEPVNKTESPDSVVPEFEHVRKPFLQLLHAKDPASPPSLPLKKVEPATPYLTPDELVKIQSNLNTLKDFVKDLWLQQGQILAEIWSRLQQQTSQDKTSKDNKMVNFIEHWLEAASIVFGLTALVPSPLSPIFGAISLTLGTVSTILSESGKDTSSVTGGDDLSGYMSDHISLNNSHYANTVKVLDYLIGNTNDCRDYIFTYKGVEKTATLRSLINDQFTKGTYYDNWLRLAARMFRRKITLTEMVKPDNQFLDLYFVQDTVHGDGVEHGHVYQPCAAPRFEKMPWYRADKKGPGIERKRFLDVAGVGTDAVIWSNAEIRHFHPEYVAVDTRGTSNTDLSGSYIKAIGEFVQNFPSAYVYPWGVSDSQTFSQKYFIMEGFAKLKDDENKPSYALCNGEFLKWLFIDDGAGNITNVDGVAFRYEFLRTQQVGFANDVCLHAQQIADEPAAKVVFSQSSADYRYGPKDSSEVNKQFHVYTGDLLLKNLPEYKSPEEVTTVQVSIEESHPSPE